MHIDGQIQIRASHKILVVWESEIRGRGWGGVLGILFRGGDAIFCRHRQGRVIRRKTSAEGRRSLSDPPEWASRYLLRALWTSSPGAPSKGLGRVWHEARWGEGWGETPLPEARTPSFIEAWCWVSKEGVSKCRGIWEMHL